MNYLRIKRKKDITGILKSGKRAHSETLTVIFTPAKESRMAVCVGKKYGKSTERNRIKRLLREVFRLRADGLKPASFLLVPKVMKEYSFSAFQRDFDKIIKRERLIETPSPTARTTE